MGRLVLWEDLTIPELQFTETQVFLLTPTSYILHIPFLLSYSINPPLFSAITFFRCNLKWCLKSWSWLLRLPFVLHPLIFLPTFSSCQVRQTYGLLLLEFSSCSPIPCRMASGGYIWWTYRNKMKIKISLPETWPRVANKVRIKIDKQINICQCD